MDGNVEWDFSATSHGKGDTDGLGGTCKQRVHEKTLARTTDPQNSVEFAECANAVCPGITILHCPKTDIEEIKASLDKSWHTEDGTIYGIPGTRKSHYFRKVSPYRTGFQTTTSDASDYVEFSFKTNKFAQKDKTASTSLMGNPCF